MIIWTSDAAPPHRVERVLPEPSVQLLFNLDRDALRWLDAPGPEGSWRVLGGSAINGPFDRPFCIDARDQRRLLGVVVPVGAAGACLGIPADELAGRHVDLEQLPALRGLRDRLGEADWADAPAILRAELRARLPLDATSPVVRFALERLGAGDTVQSVERALCMSAKTLRRRFTVAVGLTPKRYQRVMRLRRTLRRLTAPEATGLADIAVDQGYHDQAHMTREFQALTGLTPGGYRRRAPDVIGHVAV